MIVDERFVGRDIVSIRNEIYDFIKLNTDQWTDFNLSSIESQYVDIIAGVADMLCYYLDEQARETFLMTARQAKNIKANLVDMNYKLGSVESAKGVITVDVLETSPGSYDIDKFTIPRYTAIGSTVEGTPGYLTISDVIFNEGELTKEIDIIQGVVNVVSVKSSVLRNSFKYYVTDYKVPLKYVTIEDDTWIKVEDAFVEIKGGKKYSVHIDSQDRVYIMFTFDWIKYLPNGDDAVVISYLDSLGTKGIVESYRLDRIIDIIKDENDQDISNLLKVTNKLKTYGAIDSEDLILAKAKARNAIKTMDRIILLSDFDAMVLQSPYIIRANTFDWRRDISLVPEPHKMVSWVVTSDGVNSNTLELKYLRDSLLAKTVSMTSLEIRSADFVDIQMTVNLYIKGSDTYRVKLKEEVKRILDIKYSINNLIEGDSDELYKSVLDFGMLVDFETISRMVSLLSPSIVRADVSFSNNKSYLQLDLNQFPYFSKIEVNLVGDNYGQTTNN